MAATVANYKRFVDELLVDCILMIWFDLLRLRRRPLAAWRAYRAVFSACECFMD